MRSDMIFLFLARRFWIFSPPSLLFRFDSGPSVASKSPLQAKTHPASGLGWVLSLRRAFTSIRSSTHPQAATATAAAAAGHRVEHCILHRSKVTSAGGLPGRFRTAASHRFGSASIMKQFASLAVLKLSHSGVPNVNLPPPPQLRVRARRRLR
jgi:hypothetical protein